MSFHALAVLTCIAALLLATGWLFAGRLMLKRWRIEPSERPARRPGLA
jgi:hypothetical protein